MYLLNHSAAGKDGNKKPLQTAVVLCKMIHRFFCNIFLKVIVKWPLNWLPSDTSRCWCIKQVQNKFWLDPGLTGLFTPFSLSEIDDLNHLEWSKGSWIQGVVSPWRIWFCCHHSTCVINYELNYMGLVYVNVQVTHGHLQQLFFCTHSFSIYVQEP